MPEPPPDLLCLKKKIGSFPCRNFIFKDVPQLQYKNPDVQFVMSKSAAVSSPRIDVFFGMSTGLASLKIAHPRFHSKYIESIRIACPKSRLCNINFPHWSLGVNDGIYRCRF
jgi:hypothetical protein